MASIRGQRLKYLRNHLTMLEMTEEFDRRLLYVGNDACIWEFGLSVLEMAQICGEMS